MKSGHLGVIWQPVLAQQGRLLVASSQACRWENCACSAHTETLQSDAMSSLDMNAEVERAQSRSIELELMIDNRQPLSLQGQP